MKKILFTLIVPSVFLFLASCSNSPEKASPAETGVDSTSTRVDSAATKVDSLASTVESPQTTTAEEEKLVTVFLKDLYEKYVLEIRGYHDFSKIKSHFSPKILKKMRKEFEYDGGGYAVWIFRTGVQDGPSESQLRSITPEGDGWYKVSFSDMGYKGSCRIHGCDTVHTGFNGRSSDQEAVPALVTSLSRSIDDQIDLVTEDQIHYGRGFLRNLINLSGFDSCFI